MVGFVSDIQIGAKIGNGHFGEVFDGEDPAHGHVAVKILQRATNQDDGEWKTYRDAALREAQNLSRARHRNVVSVHHVLESTDSDKVLICMEHCPGGSLQEKFNDGPISIKELKRYANEILLGLDALHSRGMLHRDIKPSNILLDRRGVAKISDFGLVTDNLVMGYGSQAGYADHIAYEVWNGAGTSVKSDVWAFGMTLFRLLHGKSWYDQLQPPRETVREGGFAHSLRWLPHISKRWRTAIRRMMHDDPRLRFGSARQIMAGIAGLGTDPDWRVVVDADFIRWERIARHRRIIVLWEFISDRRHRWKAWSEPLVPGSGRPHTLDQSNGVVGRLRAESGIKEFFERS